MSPESKPEPESGLHPPARMPKHASVPVQAGQPEL
jgi:hypothetical protein